MYRVFLHNGQVTDRMDGYPADQRQHLSNDEDAAQEVADALGVDVQTITITHVDIIPAVKVIIPPAVAPDAPVQEAPVDRLAQLEARLAAITAVLPEEAQAILAAAEPEV